MKIIPVLLAGGVGSRLWPLSTEETPKQFAKIFDDSLIKSLFQQTCIRCIDQNIFTKPLIVTNERYADMVSEQLTSIGINDYEILLEPSCRDTAAAISFTAEYIRRANFQNEEFQKELSTISEKIVAILPADHYVSNNDHFVSCLVRGIKPAIDDNLVVFGITPLQPETGYGYIKPGKHFSSDCPTDCPTEGLYEVECFREKPDLKTAKHYLESGQFYWNSGIYMFSADHFNRLVEEHCPEIYQFVNKALDENIDFFSDCPKISIDFAITEKCKRLVMVKADINWSDVGSWKGLWEISEKDTDNNNYQGDIISMNSTNNLIHSKKRVVTIGLSNIVLYETEDTILIVNKDMCQEVKNISKIL